MNQRARKLLIFSAAVAALLSCAPFSSAPTAVPTFDERLYATFLAGTNTAIATRTAPFITPSATPSVTPTPSQTPKPPPSETPTPTVTFIYFTPTRVPTQTRTPTLVPPPTSTRKPGVENTPDTNRMRSAETGPYACKLISQSPEEGYTFTPGSPFVMAWEVRNSGTAIWDHPSVDLIFRGGKPMHTTPNVLDLKRNVPVRQNIVLTVNMVTPWQTGSYSATWSLRRGKYLFCTLTVKIKVK